MTMKSDLEDRSNSFDSKSGAGYIECVLHPNSCMQPDEKDCEEPSSSRLAQETDNLQSVSPPIEDNISHDSLEKQIASCSSGVTWDEKEEIVESTSQVCDDTDKTAERVVEKHDSDMHANDAVSVTNIDYNDILLNGERNLKPVFSEVQTDDIGSEPDNFMDALNSIESESEIDLDFETKRELQQSTSLDTHEMVENEVIEAPSSLFDNNFSDVVSQTGYTVPSIKETGKNIPDSLQENHPLMSEPHAFNLGLENSSEIPDSQKMIGDTVSSNKNAIRDSPYSLEEIHPHTSEPHASYLESVSPLHVPYYREEITKDTVSSNIKTFANFPNSLPEIPPLTSETHVSNLGYVSPSDVPDRKEVPENFDHSHSSESPVCERDPHTRESSILDHSVCTHNSIDSNTANDTVSEPVETDISFSSSKSSKLPDEEASKVNNNEESLGDHSVRFWTNGGLLGLEPSKPPDFNLSSSLNQGPLSTKNEMDDGSYGNLMHKGQELSGEVVEQILNESSSRLLTTDHNDDQACISEKTSGGSQPSNGQTEMNNLRDTGIAAPQSVLPAATDKKDSPEHNQGNGENSPNVFGLANRLLIKSLHRKVSFDEKSGHYNSLKSVILEQSEQNGIVGKSLPEATFKEKVSSVYPIASLPPSPPLEHMKISFHPVSGLDTSKLKLKFPDGSNHHESIRDMFPSFQLVPESSIPLDDSGFHSDGDDTFCRSSPYVSDDCQTPRSDYDSDQWESDETPETSDHGEDDSPHRRSSTESMSSTKEHGRVSIGDTDINSGHCTSTTNGVEPSLSGPLLDFPSFDSVNPVLEKESNRHSERNDVVMSHSHPEPTRPPPPPPVPPMQWRVLKPQLEKTNETQNSMSEDSEHINNQSLLESSIFQQPSLAEVEQIQINHNGHSSYDNIIHQLKEKVLV